MPSITIDVRHAYTPEQETALIDAVLAALADAFGVPAHTHNALLQVHAPHRFRPPPGCSCPERFTNISIHLMPGRSLAAKRRLYAGIVARLQPLGVPADCVLIRLHELAPQNFGVRGGQALCDLDVGYPVQV